MDGSWREPGNDGWSRSRPVTRCPIHEPDAEVEPPRAALDLLEAARRQGAERLAAEHLAVPERSLRGPRPVGRIEGAGADLRTGHQDAPRVEELREGIRLGAVGLGRGRHGLRRLEACPLPVYCYL